MPIYEYRRPDGTTFEIQQAFSDEALKTDPETGVPVERVLHAPAVHFKGKGFYNTDYGTRRRNRETAAAADSSSSSSEKSSSDSSKGDSSSSSGKDKAGKDKGAAAKDSKAAGASKKS